MDKLKEIVNRDLNKIPAEFRTINYIASKNSIWSKICVGIITCDAHKARFDNFMEIYENIFNTYGITYYIIKSDPNISSEYLIDGHYFFAKAEESYEKLVHKVMTFFSFVENKTKYDYVVKVDDGCLLKLSEIIKYPTLDYIGVLRRAYNSKSHWGKCANKELNIYVSDFKHDLDKVIGIDKFNSLNLKKAPYGGGGNGYRLSRKAITGISKYLKHAKSLDFAYEDLFIGQIMMINGITFTNKILGEYHKISH